MKEKTNLYWKLCKDYDETAFILRMIQYGLSETECECDWLNMHYASNFCEQGRYLIAEVRDEVATRMFIRSVDNWMKDGMKKSGWWNTFCLTPDRRPVRKGLYLCEIKRYRVDRNGYLNVIVNPVSKLPRLKMRFVFEREDGTWSSPAIELMFAGCRRFLPEYNFNSDGEHNLAEFLARYPKYKGMKYRDMADTVLRDWLAEEISLEEIEAALNEPTAFERLVKKVQVAVAKGKAAETFPRHPLFAGKISRKENSASHLLGAGYIGYDEVKNYIIRNTRSYEDLVKEGRISPVDSDDPLDQIEAVICYRNEEKVREKQARKEARLAKKAAKKAVE